MILLAAVWIRSSDAMSVWALTRLLRRFMPGLELPSLAAAILRPYNAASWPVVPESSIIFRGAE
jgi:hypothetical protein